MPFAAFFFILLYAFHATPVVAYPTTTAKLEWVNIKDFGAIGDGVHDDTKAISMAIGATDSGVIWFPMGNYRLTSSIAIKSFISLKGEVGGTHLLMSSNNMDNQCFMFQFSDNNNNLENFSVSGMNVTYMGNADAAGKEPNAFFLLPNKGRHTKNISFSNCVFSGWANAITFNCRDFAAIYHYYPSITNCSFQNCSYSYHKEATNDKKRNSQAIWLGSVFRYNVSGCRFVNYEVNNSDAYAATVGLYAYHSANGTITSNIFTSGVSGQIPAVINTGYGIWLYYDKGTYITGNTLKNHHNTAKIQNCSKVVLSNNNMETFGQDNALELDGSSNCIISGNTITSAIMCGLALFKDNESSYSSNNNRLVNNNIFNCGGAGILLSHSNANYINGNTVFNNGNGSDPLMADNKQGIYLDHVSETKIIHNKIFDDRENKKQEYGIFINATSSNNQVINNNILSHKLGLISNKGIGSKITIAQ